MRHAPILMLIVLFAFASGGGYSGAAYLSAGDLNLNVIAPTLEECAEEVRMASKVPEPSHLGQLIQRRGIAREGDVISASTDHGRVHLITRGEIRLDKPAATER